MKREIKERIDMINRGEVPKGYKKTKVGIVPKDWESYKVKDIMKRVRNPVDVDKNTSYKQIGIRSHGKGIFYKEEVTGEVLGNKKVFWIEPNCFIVNIVFAWELAVSKTTEKELGMIASHRFPMYKPIKEKLDLDFITYFFKTPLGKYLLELASPGGAGRNKTLGQKEFSQLNIPLSKKVNEQQKIAKILSTWDKAIELKEKLIEQKKEQKKWLMQNLLTGKVRLSGFDGEWVKVRLEDISEYKSGNIRSNALSEYGGNSIYPVYGASGIYKYIDSYEIDIEYISIIKDGAGAARTSLCNKKSSVVGTMGYILNNERVILEYLYQYLNIMNFDKYFKGTTIPHVYYKDYKNERIELPKLCEQNAIAKILSNADKEIFLLENELDALKQQKKGLMQLLLTGKVRVKL